MGKNQRLVLWTPSPIKGITKGFSSDGPHQDRCLKRRHPFGSKKSDITCGISFGVRVCVVCVCVRMFVSGKERGEERKKEKRKG